METKSERGPVNLYLKKDLIKRLQERAERLETSASAILEELAERYLETPETERA